MAAKHAFGLRPSLPDSLSVSLLLKLVPWDCKSGRG